MSQEVYVVTAYKWGNIENESYVVGVFTKKDKAIEIADEHLIFKNYKWVCYVDSCIVNQFNNSSGDYTFPLYNNLDKMLKYFRVN